MYNYNQFQPNAYEAAAEARAKAQDAATQIEFMKRDIERLLMITEALWRLLQRAHGYTDEELRNLITEIDLRDGKLDGKVKKQEELLCPACKRPVTVRQSSCIYCGQPLQHDPFAR